ncbi:hypothetical protein C5167_045581 [Papaver somniferum]|uniref:MalT-like TPR region domain-containing protein n=1 Tax=Papaver somniferum TaxID=3469 RepID=A0A4Y7LC39_PAPSO|nr:hypothetical protein C5167_045581 [Papaver somniferum]
MPGLVSVKTPPGSTPLRIHLSDENQEELSNNNNRGSTSRTPIPKRTSSPSPSTASRSRRRPSTGTSSGGKKKIKKKPEIDETALDNPDLGPFLLKQARDTIASGDSPIKALDFAIRASKSFERCCSDEPRNLELAMSLHVVAAIYCSLGRFEEAIPVLEQAIKCGLKWRALWCLARCQGRKWRAGPCNGLGKIFQGREWRVGPCNGLGQSCKVENDARDYAMDLAKAAKAENDAQDHSMDLSKDAKVGNDARDHNMAFAKASKDGNDVRRMPWCGSGYATCYISPDCVLLCFGLSQLF